MKYQQGNLTLLFCIKEVYLFLSTCLLDNSWCIVVVLTFFAASDSLSSSADRAVIAWKEEKKSGMLNESWRYMGHVGRMGGGWEGEGRRTAAEIIPVHHRRRLALLSSPAHRNGLWAQQCLPLPTHSCAAEWANPLTHTWAIEEEQVPTKERTLLLPLWAG